MMMMTSVMFNQIYDQSYEKKIDRLQECPENMSVDLYRLFVGKWSNKIIDRHDNLYSPILMVV